MRPLNILAVQLGFNDSFPDVSTLATTYNDGIYYVASFVKKQLENASVDMCQMFWGESPLDLPLERYDYILISALATHFWSNLDVLDALQRRRKKGSVLVMGGPHAAFAPYEALKYADFAVIAEGEIPTLELIQALEAGEDPYGINNIAYIDEQGLLRINECQRFSGISNTIDPGLLAKAPKLHWATVSMSRGCPFNCSFCYAIRLLGRQFRPKSVEDIVGELDGIYRQTGCSRFYVTDLNFTTRADFCEAVADAVQDRQYKFIAMSRVEHADNLDLVLRLRRAGFEEYCLGVESESQKVLTAFNKKVDAGGQTGQLRRFAENDINIHSAIIFGLDIQDRDAILATARWCADARIVHPTFVCLAEYPFQKISCLDHARMSKTIASSWRYRHINTTRSSEYFRATCGRASCNGPFSIRMTSSSPAQWKSRRARNAGRGSNPMPAVSRRAGRAWNATSPFSSNSRSRTTRPPDRCARAC